MSSSPTATEIDDELVEVLDDYLAKLQAGLAPNKRELLAAYPHLAEDLETCLASLDFVCNAAAPREPDASKPNDLTTSPPIGELGDYRLIREIGRGGMGVVYEAEQISLGRKVALKVLPFASVLDSRQLVRFKNEAQAAAQLHHPNIVPVFAVGCERAVHFYAMQFIEGQTLADVVRGAPEGVDGSQANDRDVTQSDSRSTVAGAMSTDRSVHGNGYARSVAEIGVQIANALEHAHQSGVIHRDIKPSNLLLDAHGKVWITDFGLAQFQTDAGLTMTGDLLGTLRYMSPEAAAGKPATIDHRADIYALGITLYELLTLHQAFVGDDRRSLIRGILNDEPPPLRRIRKSIPAELETIVLKAISKEPSLRYSTAREFADDLQRFLDDRPIAARRPGVVQRIVKFSRRHRGIVGTGVASLAILLITITVGTSLAAVWLAQGREAEIAAKDLAQERLFESLLTQAQASRLSERSDRMFQSQSAIAEAAELAQQLDLTAAQRLRLRNEAIASTAIACGLRGTKHWPEAKSAAARDFDPQLRHYAYTEPKGDVVVRRVDDNSIVATLASPGFPGRFVRFSPNGKYLYVAYDSGRAIVWHVGKQQQLVEFPIPPRYVGFDFSPDGSQIAVAQTPRKKDGDSPLQARHIKFYELPSGEESGTLQVTQLPICVRYVPDGKSLALSYGRAVECWDLETGKLTDQFLQPDLGDTSLSRRANRVHRMAWRCDGGQLVTILYNRARIWDVVRGEEAFTIPLRDGFYNLSFSHHDDLFAASTRQGAIVWDSMSGERLVTQEGRLVRLSRDGRHLSFQDSQGVGVSEIVFSDVYRTLVPRSREQMYGIALSERWQLVAVAGEDGLRLWSINDRRELAFLPIPRIQGLRFHDPSNSLLLSTYSGLYRWPLGESTDKHCLKIGPSTKLGSGLDEWAFSGAISFSPDGRLMTRCTSPSKISIYETESFTSGTVAEPNEFNVSRHGSVCNVSISDDLRWAVTATAHGDDVWLWNVPERKQVKKLWEGAGHTASQFSPDGESCLVIADTEFQLYEVDRWELRWRIPRDGTNQWPGPHAFSADSQLLALEADRGLRIVDCLTGKELFSLQSPGARCRSVRFSLDGQRIVELARDRIGVWDLNQLQRHLAKLQLDEGLQFTDDSHAPQHAMPDIESLEIEYGELFKSSVAKSHAQRARWFSERKLYDNARREYEIACMLDPDDALTCNNLAWLYATGPIHLRSAKQAVTLAEHALELDPNNAGYLNTLGVAYYRAGQWQAAIDTLTESAQSESNSGLAFDQFFLAMSYRQLGQTDKARALYDQAVAWWNAQPMLPEAWRDELVTFRAEADSLLKPDDAE